MRLKLYETALLVALAVAGAMLWQTFGLPRYQEIDLSVGQSRALTIAKDFLTGVQRVDLQGYKTAVIFDVDDNSDRYLQKTLGPVASRQLAERLHYDLFSWVVRFFKEKQKEEFKVTVSSKTGKIIAFSHDLDDTAPRPIIGKEEARARAVTFLTSSFHFDPQQHAFYKEDAKKFDNRLDYTFSWQAKGVEIPWDKTHGGGSAKLLTTIVVSGEDILSFHKDQFEIPDAFDRYIQNLKQTGENLSLLFRLVYLALLTAAIMMVVNRKHHMVPRMVRPFYMRVGAVLFCLMVLDILNSFQYVLFIYPTPQSFGDFLVKQFIQNLINPFFIVLAFLLPGLAGEALRSEQAPSQKQGGFLTLILSSFHTIAVGRQICIGYAVAAMVLGAQAFIFDLGYKYCGVWDELSWLTQSSATIIPAFTALLIGFHAAFAEETMFRLFAINLFRKMGAATGVAVLFSALIWGYGHSGYEIFPMWFRGVEVTCLGLILGFAYVRFGIVTAITAHFLMDVFLTVLPYLLKPQASFDFFSSMFVLSLPLLFALAAFFLNRSSQEQTWSHHFNPQQEFNHKLLMELRRSKSPQELSTLKQELLRHGWDPAIVERAFKEE